MENELKKTIEKLLNSDSVADQEVGLRSLLHEDINEEEAYYLFQPFTQKETDESLREAMHEVLPKFFPHMKKNRINEL